MCTFYQTHKIVMHIKQIGLIYFEQILLEMRQELEY